MFWKGDYHSALYAFLTLEDQYDSSARVLDCYTELALQELERGNLPGALDYYHLLYESPVREEVVSAALFSFAIGRIGTFDYSTAHNLLNNELSGYEGSDYYLNLIKFHLGVDLYEHGEYEQAHSVFIAIDAETLPQAEEYAINCRKICYDRLIAEFNDLNYINGVMSAQVSVPQGFDSPMLDGFADTEKYRAYAHLLGPWLAKDREAKIALVYELGDFLDSADHGFSMQRLYLRRYTNVYGRYFSIGSDGSADTNLPRYFLGGYYGLYSKIENGVYYIGSDEAKWTKQFSFSFADSDKTLRVYCHANGYIYELTLDESPVYR